MAAAAVALSVGAALYLLLWPHPSGAGIALVLTLAGASWLGLWAWLSGGRRRYILLMSCVASGLATAFLLAMGRLAYMLACAPLGCLFVWDARNLARNIWVGRKGSGAGSRPGQP